MTPCKICGNIDRFNCGRSCHSKRVESLEELLMSKPLTDDAMNEFREAIRNVTIKFQLSNIMIIGMLEIIQSEISREEMLRLMARVPDLVEDFGG